jgi:hypothetical protein
VEKNTYLLAHFQPLSFASNAGGGLNLPLGAVRLGYGGSVTVEQCLTHSTEAHPCGCASFFSAVRLFLVDFIGAFGDFQLKGSTAIAP